MTTVGFSCRLPIYNRGADYTIIEDAFISFPSATVTFDPAGNKGLYYDRAFSRWLPVARSAVSPDGAHYAYVEIINQADYFAIHIVDVATGIDHVSKVFWKAVAISVEPFVFDYSADGIYLAQAFEHIGAGLWLFDPPTGSIHKATDVEVPELIAGDGVVWFGRVNPADPNPVNTAASPGILPDEVDRLDIRSGSKTQWLYRPGNALDVLGVDVSGRPLIRAQVRGNGSGIASSDFFDSSAGELLIGLNSTSQRSIYRGPIVNTISNVSADSHGIWMGSEQGIYLYSVARGLQKVSNHPGNPANGCF